MIIYKITNNINNKVYIGQTIRDLETRLAEERESVQEATDGLIMMMLQLIPSQAYKALYEGVTTIESIM